MSGAAGAEVYGAAPAGAAEYTGDYDLDEEGLPARHRDRWDILADTGPRPRPGCSRARTWYESGARLVGGCCATTPEQIRRIRAEFG